MKQSHTPDNQTIRRLLAQLPPADWVVEMIEYYRRTGSYRPEDLRRLLGDQTKGVTVGPDTDVGTLFASWSSKKS